MEVADVVMLLTNGLSGQDCIGQTWLMSKLDLEGSKDGEVKLFKPKHGQEAVDQFVEYIMAKCTSYMAKELGKKTRRRSSTTAVREDDDSLESRVARKFGGNINKLIVLMSRSPRNQNQCNEVERLAELQANGIDLDIRIIQIEKEPSKETINGLKALCAEGVKLRACRHDDWKLVVKLAKEQNEMLKEILQARHQLREVADNETKAQLHEILKDCKPENRLNKMFHSLKNANSTIQGKLTRRLSRDSSQESVQSQSSITETPETIEETSEVSPEENFKTGEQKIEDKSSSSATSENKPMVSTWSKLRTVLKFTQPLTTAGESKGKQESKPDFNQNGGIVNQTTDAANSAKPQEGITPF